MLRGCLAFCVATLIAAGSVGAQGTNVIFGGIKADTTAPVEVTSDSLTVDQSKGTAVFTGNVTVGQGAMRLAADEVKVEYAPGDKSKIDRLVATGHVTLVSGDASAEGESAVYSVATGAVDISGNVLLTQSGNAMTGQMLSVDLKTGTGHMDGRVKTVLQPGGN